MSLTSVASWLVCACKLGFDAPSLVHLVHTFVRTLERRDLDVFSYVIPHPWCVHVLRPYQTSDNIRSVFASFCCWFTVASVVGRVCDQSFACVWSSCSFGCSCYCCWACSPYDSAKGRTAADDVLCSVWCDAGPCRCSASVAVELSPFILCSHCCCWCRSWCGCCLCCCCMFC